MSNHTALLILELFILKEQNLLQQRQEREQHIKFSLLKNINKNNVNPPIISGIIQSFLMTHKPIMSLAGQGGSPSAGDTCFKKIIFWTDNHWLYSSQYACQF